MNVHCGVEGVEFSLMDGQVVVAEVADINGTSTVLSKLVGTGTTNAERRVCTWNGNKESELESGYDELQYSRVSYL